jgi:hypothetical protein
MFDKLVLLFPRKENITLASKDPVVPPSAGSSECLLERGLYPSNPRENRAQGERVWERGCGLRNSEHPLSRKVWKPLPLKNIIQNRKNI